MHLEVYDLNGETKTAITMLKRKFVATLFGELVRLIPTSSKVVFRVAAADLAAVPPKPSAVTLLDPI